MFKVHAQDSTRYSIFATREEAEANAATRAARTGRVFIVIAL